ncbi:MAG: serine/threonine-protein kinase [Planctomycetota bacterium]
MGHERYELLGELGRGGVGVVYRARDREGDREVALKVLLEPLQGARLERFRREGEVTAQLRHVGIVRVHDAGLREGRAFIAYELVEGARPLDEVLPELPLERRVALVRDAARALGHAHAQGVVHRDVKPENLLIDAAGALRVADFGLAHVEGEERLTRTGAWVGTPITMAPEQLGGSGGAIGPPTDVWALGVVLYLCLTDELPFCGDSLAELASRIAAANPSPPRALAPSLAPALEQVCLRALRRDPAERFPDGEALARALDEVLRGALRRRRGPTAALLGVLGAGLGLTLVLGLARPAPARPSPVASAPAPDPSASPEPSPRVAAAEPSRPAGRVVPDPLQVEPLALDPDRLAIPAHGAWMAATREGDPRGMAELARFFVRGEHGVPRDGAQGLLWYARASAAEDHAPLSGMTCREAEVQAAYVYLLGLGGVARDVSCAVAWFERAAKRDHGAALVELAALRLGLTPGLERDPAAAARHLRRATEVAPRTDEGWVLLARLYELGRGVSRDPREARRLVDRGCALQQRAKQLEAERGRQLWLGVGRPEDPRAARQELEQQLRSGSSLAGLYLALLLWEAGHEERARELLGRVRDATLLTLSRLCRLGLLAERELLPLRAWLEELAASGHVGGAYCLAIQQLGDAQVAAGDRRAARARLEGLARGDAPYWRDLAALAVATPR